MHSHKLIPGPAPLGMLWQFYRNPMRFFAQSQAKYGDLVRFQVGPYLVFHVTDPALAQHVLNSPNYEISAKMDDSFTGKGLATSNGTHWQQNRRLMQPSFHQRAIADFGAGIVQHAEALAVSWQHAKTLDVLPDLIHLNHRILGEKVLGLDFALHPDLLEMLHIIRDYINRRVQAVVSVPEALPTPRNQRFKHAVTYFNARIQEHIAAAEAHPPDQPTVLSMLLTAQDPRSDYRMDAKQLRDELNTLFLNGYEDPAVTVAWALYALAQHPHVLERLREEIRAVIGEGVATVEHLKTMPYLNQVIDEVLRLYPPTWSMLRDVREADVLGDYEIPQWSTILLNTYLLHRHPDHWQQPDDFLPERFAGDYPEAAYLPFGGGPRRCIGQALALMEIKLTLLTILRRVDYSLLEGRRVGLNAMSSLKPEGGLFLRVQGI